MHTRKFARTMQEAFGPYTSNHIEEPKRPMDWQDRVVLTGCAIVSFAFIVLVVCNELL